MAEPPRIVILDDDDAICAMLTATLDGSYECVVGKTGREGLKICGSNRVDLVLTDIGMPELDGIQMLEEFQKDPCLAAIPVLVLTATHFSQRSRSQVSCFPQVRGILLKPCSVEEITGAIARVLKERLAS